MPCQRAAQLRYVNRYNAYHIYTTEWLTNTEM
nr:MAG TPA: hypothetical protein [Caudoviricetes sp.]